MDSAKSILRVTRLIHWVLLLPPVLFGTLVYLLLKNDRVVGDESIQEFIYVPMILMIFSIIGGRVLYVKLMKGTVGKTLTQKLQIVMKATIMRNALFEMVGLVTCLAAYWTGNVTILFLIVIIALQFGTNKPSLAKLEREGVITRDEASLLN